ncbi:MAG: alpha-amylase family glycosyl hydrolase [Xenococcaceae cyanobacterium MO_188.B29]|nr:alpha-amylase family glycosyl hydrolase [Xenococcaceae cyanobacterium MO_188.B29]
MTKVEFTYLTGLKKDLFRNARLTGSWDENGRYSDEWTSIPMEKGFSEDGCPCFQAKVELDDSQVGSQFHWGVILDGPAGNDLWGIPTEINSGESQARYRTFTLQTSSGNLQAEKYYLTNCRYLGSHKYYRPNQNNPGLQFSVWAPNAQKVDLAFGGASGYIADNGEGIDASLGEFSMARQENGVWQTDVNESRLANFSSYDHKPYMFRITKEDGGVAYRTDLYSRCQIGQGNTNPNGQPYNGNSQDLDGTKSCSVVVDLDLVAQDFYNQIWPRDQFISDEEFWSYEFNSNKPLPTKVEDLVIYELHLGALGYGKDRPGNFEDAMQLMDYFEDLGVNAIELLPMAEFRDETNWGYETSHYFTMEYSAGGRDQLKHFVRECHRRGIAVILDVVYNHYSPDGERAEWGYDSDAPERNMYYWYEGDSSNYFYPDGRPFPEGGYVDNMSTGYSPRFHEEIVRKMFISSAASLLTEFHIDGFRVDQTTSMHSYNVLHADGRPMGNVNVFGAKFLREWTRTLKLIKPSVMLMAEDHSDWDLVTVSSNDSGLGFDAAWYSEFYHHLIGDARQGTEYAKLIPTAGFGDNRPLAMNYFAGALAKSRDHKVVYHESHDEAGNSSYEQGGNKIESRRTIVSAVDGAPLVGETRSFAEARVHFACGMTMLSAGTPMFFMGEEIGAQKQYRYRDFLNNREDLLGERQNNGKRLFRFYQDLIRFRLNHSGLRSHNIDILHVHNANRVIAFKRWDETEEFLVVGSLNNSPFANGYIIENERIPNGNWREMFNSNLESYGGNNVGNLGANITSDNGRIGVVIPANGFVVLQKV